jgi:hypothetical protein
MVRDKITHVLFGRDVVQNATGIADIDQGEIIVIAAGTTSTGIAGGTLLTAANITALSDADGFYLVEGKLNSNISDIISPKLTKGSIAAHRGTSYAAPVEQVSYIGDNGAAGTINAIDNTEYSLSVAFVYDKDIYSKRSDSKTYHYTSGVGATATSIATGFVAEMMADADFAAQATATLEVGGGSAGIKIVGNALTTGNYDNPNQVIFNVAVDKGFTSATQVDEYGFLYLSGAAPVAGTSVAPTPGVGTAAQFKAMEANNIGFTTGQTNKRAFPVIAADPRINAVSGTYDVYVIDYTDTHESADNGLSATRTTAGQIIVANDISTIVNGSTAALEALFLQITGTVVNL